MAKHEARKLIQDPKLLSLTLSEVRGLMDRESDGELTPIVKEVSDLMSLAADGQDDSGFHDERRVKAITALLYLLNPFDDLYDFHHGIGYQDDIGHIREVHGTLFSNREAGTQS